MSDAFAICEPAALVDAIDGAELRQPLPPAVQRLVDIGLRERTHASLAVSRRALLVWERFHREDGRRVPIAVTEALVKIRAALRSLRGDR